MLSLPARTKDYIGPVTDTRIWDRFDLRSNDIILSTPPKCGTTWSQAILMMLLNGEADNDRPVWQDSLWLDCGFRDQDAAKSVLDNTPGRRCIKSHTPFDGIPYRPDVTYLTVYRHPIDVLFSFEKHVGNMTADILDFHFPDTPGAAFERFLEAPASDAGTDDLTLASLIHHYISFKIWSHLPNVHFFHYSDLSRDPEGQIERFAKLIDLTPKAELVSRIVKATSFTAMKNTTRRDANFDGKGAFANPADFFDSATSDKWKGRLSQVELDAYKDKITQLADPQDILWLENGTP